MRVEITFFSSSIIFLLFLLLIPFNLQIIEEHDSKSSSSFITSSKPFSEL
ncbi:hypothetical protein Hanom_Chr08g00715861 [Helianthus anomalus]